MPQMIGEQASRRPASPPLAARIAALLLLGLLAGAATSILQKYLGSPWLSLVNSASPWLAAMFAAGALWGRPAAAALAGTTTGLLELAGYYLTAAARGYSAGSILLFWAACALIGGPLFGAAGWAWWRGPARLSGLGTAALPAAFLAEAAVAYRLAAALLVQRHPVRRRGRGRLRAGRPAPAAVRARGPLAARRVCRRGRRRAAAAPRLQPDLLSRPCAPA
jgi:hypothetical protein